MNQRKRRIVGRCANKVPAKTMTRVKKRYCASPMMVCSYQMTEGLAAKRTVSGTMTGFQNRNHIRTSAPDDHRCRCRPMRCWATAMVIAAGTGNKNAALKSAGVR